MTAIKEDILDEDEQLAYDQFVHNPTQSYKAFYELGKKLHGTKGISTGSKNLDQIMVPTRGPWVRTWVAAQAQGKSTFLRIIAFNEASRLELNGLTDKFYVAHISYEEAVDAQEIYYQRNRHYTNEDFWRGTVRPEDIIKGGLQRAELPIYWLGESMSRSDPDSPPMTIDLCLAGIRAIYKVEKKLPSCIILDYVQEIEVDPYSSGTRTERVIEGMKQVIRMGTLTGCAIELGAQARRSSLKNNPPLPDQDDLEWAHYVSQKSTNMVGLWRPWTTHNHNENALKYGVPVLEGKSNYPLSAMLTVAKPLKHRPGKLGQLVPMEVNPDTLTIKDFPDVLQWQP
jgi:hypothetical protein